MPSHVTDSSSNAPDRIAHAARVIGKSARRRKVFQAIYHGRRAVKTVQQLADATGLSRKAILTEGKKLASNEIVDQLRQDGETAYRKDHFIAVQRGKILSLATNKSKLDRFPTKTNPAGSSRPEVVRFPRNRARARLITVDDIDSFRKVRKTRKAPAETKIPEKTFKDGVKELLGEPGEFKDWGGEKNDLYTTRLEIKGRRRAAAFAFKGPGKNVKKLTPAHLGKNGDQIQRLFQSAADCFIVQYWRPIDETVLEQMKMWAFSKSLMEDREIFYGIIDGRDSSRLILAYPEVFNL